MCCYIRIDVLQVLLCRVRKGIFEWIAWIENRDYYFHLWPMSHRKSKDVRILSRHDDYRPLSLFRGRSPFIVQRLEQRFQEVILAEIEKLFHEVNFSYFFFFIKIYLVPMQFLFKGNKMLFGFNVFICGK